MCLGSHFVWVCKLVKGGTQITCKHLATSTSCKSIAPTPARSGHPPLTHWHHVTRAQLGMPGFAARNHKEWARRIKCHWSCASQTEEFSAPRIRWFRSSPLSKALHMHVYLCKFGWAFLWENDWPPGSLPLKPDLWCTWKTNNMNTLRNPTSLLEDRAMLMWTHFVDCAGLRAKHLL